MKIQSKPEGVPQFSLLTPSGELFYQWLTGFVDGEGSFQINLLKNSKGNITKFSFLFKINLHVDDKHVLFAIIELLNMGKVYIMTYKSNEKRKKSWYLLIYFTHYT